MMLSSILLVALVSVSSAADNFAPDLPANSTCTGQYAGMYNKCRSNALGVLCLSTDNFCNCRQAQNLATCITYCSSDPSVYSNLPRQNEEVNKWCSLVPSSLLTMQPTSTTAGGTTSPTGSSNPNNILNGAESFRPTFLSLSFMAAGVVANRLY
ncbi:hypothetical protein K493DRAFT_375266 [Basidiobolus meristosporus CBS 931.73]|uniref:Extracellular membrane protein CFEM domain-containing protein n=1 Tax=Basidiobolus meristosporus CBS 931.73 TaxID=1314790 RepID=A0A1Y1Y5S5_9FUNG|nr:hypothetical protein K493DRAFT_375266 [Basidiobolus meristosporus CBS 931.73]|eukprot:ORX93380.1 hypothetical protein K493DRAFT_375266 [Basidiobolus meristosporus CBS 931.73]